MIAVEQVSKSYNHLQVLKNINLQVQPAEIVSIVGASGAGKTTLLQLMGTLDKPDNGSILIAGTDTTKLSGKKLAAFRNKHIGFIFQFHQLLPEFTALENICMPAWIGGNTSKQVEAYAKQLLGYLNVENRSHHKPSELSGGEQQRIAVARALINKPAIVLADEPSGNLDSANAQELHKLFFTLRAELNQTFVLVTHNDDLANSADRKLTIRDGIILGT
ncbi:MAG: ABC transporter ATP-binding protein [Bacteroidia bacterium]|jgi:lipoprotein-releasing system ATP-binding protein|nr:ABC transporter ATP-binding protein [Bacteroidia bacterium]